MDKTKYLGSPTSKENIVHKESNNENKDNESKTTTTISSIVNKSSKELLENQSPLLLTLFYKHHTLQKFKKWITGDINQKCPGWKGYYKKDRKHLMIQKFIEGIREPIKRQLNEELNTFYDLNAVVQRTEELHKKQQQILSSPAKESFAEESNNHDSITPVPESKDETTNPVNDKEKEIQPDQPTDQNEDESNKTTVPNESAEQNYNEIGTKPWIFPIYQPDETSETEDDIVKEVNKTYNKLFKMEISTSHLWKKIVSLPTFNGNERLEDFFSTISTALESKLLSEDQKVTLILSRLNGAAATTTADILHSTMTTTEIIDSLKYHYGSTQNITFKTIQNRKQREDESFRQYGTKLQEMVRQFFNNERGYDDQYRQQQEKIFFINGLTNPYNDMLRSRILYLRNIEDAIKEAEKIEETRNALQHQAQLLYQQPCSSRSRFYQNPRNRQNQSTRFSNNQYQPNKRNFNKNKPQYNHRSNHYNYEDRSYSRRKRNQRRKQNASNGSKYQSKAKPTSKSANKKPSEK